MCKKCLIIANHDVCVLNYVNGMNNRGDKQNANVSNDEYQKKHKPKAKKPKKLGSKERLASPKPHKPRSFLRWSLAGGIVDLKGKIIASSDSECQSDCSKVVQICLLRVDSGCSKHMTGNLKLLINFVWKFSGTARFGNDHIAVILGYDFEVFQNSNIIKYIFVPHVSKEKSKKASHPPKPVPNSKQRLHFLHMDLCRPMRVKSINGKQYILVIVDDYSRYTWVHFLRSKDEAPVVIKTFLKKLQVLLQALVIIVRTDNGTEFNNQVLKEYFDSVGISHQSSSVRTPQQNRVLERRNRTLVEDARTMLIFSCASLFLWAEAIAIACYSQNRSIIHRRFNKTPYELINGRTPDISFLHVFEALCYPKNDREDIGKLGAKGDIGFFIGYSANSSMAFEQRSSKPGLQSMTSGQITMYDDYIGGQPSAAPRTAHAALANQNLPTPNASTTVEESALIPTNSSSQSPNIPITSQDVDVLQPQQQGQQQDNQA
ncbi:retrovirus-related pol polyprotein from transposon TNT 1-94 [Tanacetum coccineum]|uniref:Retrovirus-related pol polyprotein from transposon TNT 1-94 n=1 Tax=Tanacetum coccineum TaxID=301880 RepID=A0ABQ4Z1C9_9ASTR